MAERVATIKINFAINTGDVVKSVKGAVASINDSLKKAQPTAPVAAPDLSDYEKSLAGMAEYHKKQAALETSMASVRSAAESLNKSFEFKNLSGTIAEFSQLSKSAKGLYKSFIQTPPKSEMLSFSSDTKEILKAQQTAKAIASESKMIFAPSAEPVESWKTRVLSALTGVKDRWQEFRTQAQQKITASGVDGISAALNKIGLEYSATRHVVDGETKAISASIKGLDVSTKEGEAAFKSLRAELKELGRDIKVVSSTGGIKIDENGNMSKQLATTKVQISEHISLWSKLTGVVKTAATVGFNSATTSLKVLSGVLSTIGKVATAPLRMLSRGLGDVGRMILAMAGFTGIRSIARDIRDLIHAAGPMESVRVQFANFLQQARQNVPGFSDNMQQVIKDMRDMTGGALDTTTMLKNANIAFSLIGDGIAKDLPKMMAIAQAASLSTGQDLQYLFESLVKGVGRLSTRWIDNLGISINLSQVTQEYAASLGKTSGQLTIAERTQGLLNATMKEGEKILAKTGNMSVFVSTQMSALSSNFKNIRDSAIAAFSPFATVLLQYVNTFLDSTTPKVEQWGDSFVREFARMPTVAQAAMAEARSQFDVGIFDTLKTDSALETEQNAMGRRAAQWAINALSWGANVGSEFVSGIITGFASLISAAMNFIAGVLQDWFMGHSPPKVAPNIDVWGAETMEEWVKGMLSYPVDSEAMPTIKQELRELLQGDVQDSLFQWGVDSIADWAKGLATIDLEFLQRGIEQALDAAKRVNDELSASYKGQRSELFKLQVLNKDPAAIKAKIGEVKQTKKALTANELQIKQLELRKALLEDQLKLFRLLEQAIEKQEAAAKRAAAEKAGAGGSGLDENALGIDFPIALPLAGTKDLEDRVKGIRTRLEEIMAAPLDKVTTAWEGAFGENGTATLAFQNLVKTITDNAPAMKTKIDDIKQSFDDMFATDIEGFKTAVGEMFATIGEEMSKFKTDAGKPDVVLEALGDSLLAIGSGIAKGLGYTVAGAFKFLRGITVLLTEDFIKGLGLMIGGALQFAFGLIGGVIEQIAQLIFEYTGTTFSEVAKQWLFNIQMFGAIVVKSITNISAGIVETIESLPLGKVLKRIFPEASETWNSDAIRQAADNYVKSMLAPFGAIEPELQKVSPTIDRQMENIFNAMLPTERITGNAIRLPENFIDMTAVSMSVGNIPSVWAQSIQDGFALQAPNIQSSMQMMMDAVDPTAFIPTTLYEGAGKELTFSLATGIDNGIPDITKSITNMFTELDTTSSDWGTAEWETYGDAIALGLSNGIVDGTENTAETLRALYEYLKTTSQDELQSHSPSLVYAEFGKSIDEGLAQGINQNTTPIISAIRAALDSVLAAAAPYENTFRALGGQIMRSMAQDMIIIAQDTEYGFVKVGMIIAESMVVGIEARMAYLLQFIREAAQRTIEEINNAYGISSPSKVFREVGENMTLGLAQGVSGMANVLPPSVLNSEYGRAAGMSRATAAAPVTVNLNGPIVENMVVPNATVGREVSRQISRDIGRMAMAQRTPA